MRVFFVILITLISLVSGLAGGKFLLADKPTLQPQERTNANQGNSSEVNTTDRRTIAPEEVNIPKELISPDPNINKALKKFDTTKNSINQIINDLSKNPEIKNLIKRKIKLILQNENLDDLDINSSSTLDQGLYLKWIKAIYSYQTKKSNGKEIPDGIIEANKKTANNLKQDVITEIKRL